MWLLKSSYFNGQDDVNFNRACRFHPGAKSAWSRCYDGALIVPPGGPVENHSEIHLGAGLPSLCARLIESSKVASRWYMKCWAERFEWTSWFRHQAELGNSNGRVSIDQQVPLRRPN